MFVFDREILGNLFASIFSKERKINFPNLQEFLKQPMAIGSKKRRKLRLELAASPPSGIGWLISSTSIVLCDAKTIFLKQPNL